MPGYRQKKRRLQQLVKQQQQQRINKIQAEGHPFKAVDAFRVAQKHFKFYKHIKTDFSQLVDPQKDLKRVQGIEEYDVYEIEEPKGAYLVKKFMGVQEQIRVGFEALNDYCRKPYRNNLDGTNGLYLQEEKKEQDLEKEDEFKEQNTKQQVKEEILDKKQQQPRMQSQQSKGYYFNDNIRMANLGYQYDWPHRCYPKTKVPIPQTIASLTLKAQKLFRSLLTNFKQAPLSEYHGEAVIVNYYKPKEYMIGHLDDGEEDQENPIFSYNFGLSAVFLLGFEDKDKKPISLELQTGDLLIMSGQSRRCYHGVPRIIEDSYHEAQLDENVKKIVEEIDKEVDQVRKNGFKQVMQYFKGHRLNLNIRQVWKRTKQQNQQLE